MKQQQQQTISTVMCKKLTLFFIVFFTSLIVNAQESDTRTHPYTKGGHYKAVGSFLFSCNADQRGNDKNQNFYVSFPNKGKKFHDQVGFEVQREGAIGARRGMFTDNTHLYLVGNWDNNGQEHIIFGFGSNERNKVREEMRLTHDGRLGIGTSSPRKALHVNGDTYAEGHVYYYAHEGDGKSGTAYIQARDETYRTSIALQFRTQYKGSIRNALRIDPDGTSNFLNTTNFLHATKFNNTAEFKGITTFKGKTIFADSLGIGVEKPKEKLHIAGNVKAKSFIADASVFPDYVFSTTYALKPLHEIKKFVKTNKHLPGMPTEKEVVTNGLDIKKVTTVSVEKIEELYLHTIKQQELIEKQQEVIKRLEKRLTLLESTK